METENHLIMAQGLGLLTTDACNRFIRETIEVRKMIHGYRRKVLESLEQG